MSLEQVKQFYQMVTTDEAVRMRLNGINEQVAGQALDAESIKEFAEKWILPIAAEYGVPFTYEELKEYNETLKNPQGDLSMEELDSVAGGVGAGGGICFFVGLAIGIEAGDAFCVIFGL